MHSTRYRPHRLVQTITARILLLGLIASLLLVSLATAQQSESDVFIVNSPSNPVPTQPAGEPYQQSFTMSRTYSGSTAYRSVRPPTPPAGKRLVVRHINIRDTGFLTLHSQYVIVDLVVTGGARGFGRADALARSYGTAGLFGSQPLLLYVEADQTFSVTGRRHNTDETPWLHVTITGYLVDVD